MGSFAKILAVSLLAEIIMCTGMIALCLHIAPGVHSQAGLALLFFLAISPLLSILVMNALAVFSAISAVLRGAEERTLAAYAAPAIVVQTGFLAFICLTQGKAVNAATAAIALALLGLLLVLPGKLSPPGK